MVPMRCLTDRSQAAGARPAGARERGVSRCPAAHNPPPPLRRSPPVSFKRLFGRTLFDRIVAKPRPALPEVRAVRSPRVVTHGNRRRQLGTAKPTSAPIAPPRATPTKAPRTKAVPDEISHSPGHTDAASAPKPSPSVAPPTSAPLPACALRTQRESTLAAGILVADPALRMVTKLSEVERTWPSTNPSPLVRMRTG